MTKLAYLIRWFAEIFLGNIDSPNEITVGLALLTAGIGLIVFTITSTVTTTIFFGLITKSVSTESTPFVAIGWLIIGLSAIFLSWGVFYP